MTRSFKLIVVLALAALLCACGPTEMYKAQLDFMDRQITAQQNAEQLRQDRLQEREAMCTGIVDAGTMAVCMLGVTATTLADKSGNGGGQQIIQPPPAPPSALQIAGGMVMDGLKTIAPWAMNRDNVRAATEQSIAQTNALYGYLGNSVTAWANFGNNAVAGMTGVANNAVGAMGNVSGQLIAQVPNLQPNVTVSGTGNMVGNGNQAAIDQSRAGGHQVRAGDGSPIAIDQSQTGRDRQDGQNNRQHSDDTTVIETNTTCTATSGATGATQTGATGATGTGTVTCPATGG